MAKIVDSRVLHELIAVLVDRIVGQVHAQVVQVTALRRHVVLRSKSGETFFVDEDP